MVKECKCCSNNLNTPNKKFIGLGDGIILCEDCSSLIAKTKRSKPKLVYTRAA